MRSRFGAGPGAAPSPGAELDRVLALPRRRPVEPDTAKAAALVELMTERLSLGPRACACAARGRRCITRLFYAQAWALYEMGLVGGLLAPVGVGHGKTGLDVLAAVAVRGVDVAVCLVPPGLVEQFVGDYHAWAEHFRVPSLVVCDGSGRGWVRPGAPALHLMPYSRLSHESATRFLLDLRPDLVVADEAHNLKNRTSVRTRRLLDYFVVEPTTRFCGWSGTITSSSLHDFAHLLALALKGGSPLPVDPDVVDEWAAAVDPSDWPAPPGALKALCLPGEAVRAAVARRVVETRGVVSTRSAASGASIRLRERRAPPVPDAVRAAVARLRSTWTREDGEELVDALSVAKCARELACGFFYRWRFPGDPPRRLVDEWFDARKAWHRELREKLRDPLPHLDSPLLCARAAIRAYDGRDHGDLPTWRAESWPRWVDVRDSVSHVTEAVWVDDYLARDAAAWARASHGIVWYEHRAFGEAVARHAGLALHDGGDGDREAMLADAARGSVVASLNAHGDGVDGLQLHVSTQLVANPPPSAKRWEQLLGRTHRPGQRADEVVALVYRHTAEMCDAVDRAVALAKYVEEVTRQCQKLLVADCEFTPGGGP